MVAKADGIQIPNERQKRKQAFWSQVETDLANGLTPKQIADKYINPITGNFYTPEHIYLIIRKLKSNA